MTVAIQAGASLVDKAREAIAEREAEAAYSTMERLRSARRSAIAILVQQLATRLGVSIDESSVKLYDDSDSNDGVQHVCAYVDIDGLRFEARPHADLELARLCTYPYCTRPGDRVRTPIYHLRDLGDALAKSPEHSPYDHHCGVIYEDGKALTDNTGKLLLPRAPFTPFTREQRAIDDVLAAAEVYAQAVVRIMELEDGRASEKSQAIRRLMQTRNDETGKQHSASSAERIVELDSEYSAYRKQQRDAEVHRWRADGALFAAKQHARLAVSAVRAGDE